MPSRIWRRTAAAWSRAPSPTLLSPNAGSSPPYARFSFRGIGSQCHGLVGEHALEPDLAHFAPSRHRIQYFGRVRLRQKDAFAAGFPTRGLLGAARRTTTTRLLGRPRRLYCFTYGWEPIPEATSLKGGARDRFLLEPVTGAAVVYDEGW